jgi:hypothetical protein
MIPLLKAEEKEIREIGGRGSERDNILTGHRKDVLALKLLRQC